MADRGLISPDAPAFSGFVFKIQANMNRRHRDRVAFVRICSGTFMKDMALVNARLGETVRATRPYRFFGGGRETVERAFPGDVIGLPNPGKFAIGDTLYAGEPVRYPRIPRFPPEHFGRARLLDTRAKQFDIGLRQLEEEGLMQVVFPLTSRREPILCVVGPLQLDVVEARLRQEYGVDCRIEPLSFVALRWLRGDPQEVADATLPTAGVLRAADREGRTLLLFESPWHLDYAAGQNPGVEFLAVG
jgi:peptide chain release factor 3